jgi:hypothetical protein
MSMRLGRVLMRLSSMSLCGRMISLRMVLSRCVVSLCRVFVMFRCLLVCVVCHKSPCLKRRFCYIREPTRCLHHLHLCRVKISRKPRGYHPINTTIGEFEGPVHLILVTLLLNLPIYGVLSVLSTTGGIVPVDSAPNRGYS